VDKAGGRAAGVGARRRAPVLTVVCASLFLVGLALLHVLEPEFDPGRSLISEYALGAYGWVMTGAFLSLSASCLALRGAVSPCLASPAGRIGLAFFLVVAVGLGAAAIFPTDPASTAVKTLTGKVHGFCALLVIPVFPIAATLVARDLSRAPAPGAKGVGWATLGVWIGLLGFVIYAISAFGRPLPLPAPRQVGWPNRLMMVTDALWLITAARAGRAAGRGDAAGAHRPDV
jgi:hypothetical protein